MANSKALLSVPILLINMTFFMTFASSHAVEPCPPQTKRSEAKNCPKNTIKFGACGSWLGLVHEVVGMPPSEQCCSVVKGLADLEAAVCFCSAVKAGVLGVVKVDVPAALSLLFNACEKKVPEGFVCP